MPTFSAAYTTAGGPYNVFNVISGAQTAGVTPSVGASVRPAASRNYSRLEIMVDSSVIGILYVSTGPPANAVNKLGSQVPNGQRLTWVSEGKMGAISLADKSFFPDTTGMIVHITYEA